MLEGGEGKTTNNLYTRTYPHTCIRGALWWCSFVQLQGAQVNEAACDLAREVANEGDALVAGGVSQTPSYLSCKSETEVKAIFKKQMDVFIKKNVDFLIAEVRPSCHTGRCSSGPRWILMNPVLLV